MTGQVENEEGRRDDHQRLRDAVLTGVADDHLLGVYVADSCVADRRRRCRRRRRRSHGRLVTDVHIVERIVLGRVEHDVDDLRVHDEDDDERHEERDDAVDVARHGEHRVIAG